MTEAGFRQGSFSARAFYRKRKKVGVVVGGGDFAVLGQGKSLDWFLGVVQTRSGGEVRGPTGEAHRER